MNPEHYVNPPVYTLIMVTNFFAIAFGFIFKDMLEYQVSQWNTMRQSQSQINYKTPNLIVAYLGLCISLLVFVGASLSVFCSIYWIAYGLSAIVVLPTALLIWVQLGSMLILLVRGGSEAVDIDSYGAGQVLDVQAPKANLSK
ncbi:hypothetical protein AVDCRST_MAG92-1242 [uncultured Coleofasciculus sp.]|uniref:Uncharacterized protein n=1 Tax=uncultured Coleofasciculus sp. TaxID=1267456 RepID=A0A6J4HWF6_9CYAN|nr:hypothetical protein AVDCRST_MAG92-1242 [uncultured Coleofasciculus sp.]